MHNTLGFSLYLSTSPAQCLALRGWAGAGAPIFLSLHIGEEVGPDFCRRAQTLCHTLADQGFRVIADVSTRTQQLFGCDDLVELARRLRLWALRIDYGFSSEEIGAMAEKMPIVLNASTTTPEEARHIAGEGRQVFAMHNFYPRRRSAAQTYFRRSSHAGSPPGPAALRGLRGPDAPLWNGRRFSG